MDIVKRVHETSPEIPAVTLRSYVIAMAPNHPFSGHWPSIRKLHGVFEYLGEGHFQIKEKVETTKAVVGTRDLKRRLWYCEQCGYVAYREDPPLVCPICKAKKERFKEIKIHAI